MKPSHIRSAPLRCVLVVFVLLTSHDARGQCELEQLLPPDLEDGDFYGRVLAIEGDLAVIGASSRDHETAGVDAGAVYVFRRGQNGWIQDAMLSPADAETLDGFGASVDVSGDRVIVGAPGGDDGVELAGSAYVFRFDGAGWIEEAKLLNDQAHEFDRLGHDVAISGDIAVVSTPNTDDPFLDAGSACVFRFDGVEWGHEATLTEPAAEFNNWFGVSVAIDGDTLVVGCLRDDDNGPNSGSAYVFRYAASTWTLEDKLLASDGGASERFGIDVAVSGDRVLVGASRHGDDNPGAAYVYERLTETEWVETAKLAAADLEQGDLFGQAVGLAGDRAMIGAPGDENGAGADSGAAYLFRETGTGWLLDAKLSPTDAATYDQYGGSVAIDREVLVGRSDHYLHEPDGGAAALFSAAALTVDCNGNLIEDACDTASGRTEDCNDNGIPDECEAICAADVDCSGTVDFVDLLILLGTWGPCPAPTSSDEGEPCGESVNGGCNDPQERFRVIDCGETINGTGWWDGTIRDTDWFELVVLEPTDFTMTATMGFEGIIGRIEYNDCAIPSTLNPSVIGAPGEDVSFSTGVLPPGKVWFYVAAAPFFTGPVTLCNSGREFYTASLTCTPDPRPCPSDGDGDGFTGFADLLQVLSDWGPCP